MVTSISGESSRHHPAASDPSTRGQCRVYETRTADGVRQGVHYMTGRAITHGARTHTELGHARRAILSVVLSTSAYRPPTEGRTLSTAPPTPRVRGTSPVGSGRYLR